jgi:hypothetical protein
MTSWKTTVGGLLMAAGMSVLDNPDPRIHLAAKVCEALGAALLGMSARDNNVTSEQAGAAPAPLVPIVTAPAPVAPKPTP